MIDRLTLLTSRVPDYKYLEVKGNLKIDEHRKFIYKEMYLLDRATVFCKPHKYSPETNDNISFCRVDLNPKYFECFDDMWAYLCSIFDAPDLKHHEFTVSRIDLAVDIEDFPIVNLLSILHVKRIRLTGFSFFKGTVYAGTNPKVRIYNKVAEIKSRVKKGHHITEYEKMILESGKVYSRFEIQKRPEKTKLDDILNSPESLASDFDRIEIFKFNEDEMSGVLQFAFSLINRKSRKEFEKSSMAQ